MDHLRKLTWRHAVMLLVLVGIALLLRTNIAVPVHFRFPGLLVLVLFAIYLVANRPMSAHKH